MKLEDILTNYNVDGEIYRCDIKEYFGWELSEEKIDELHKLFTEIRDQK